MKTLWKLLAAAVLVALIAVVAVQARQAGRAKESKTPPIPKRSKTPPLARLKTYVLGGVEPSGEQLAAMQKGNYLLHARDGKLTRVSAQKSRLPHDPKGHTQITYTAQDPRDRNTVYVNQVSIICKTTDGGKTWTSYPREMGRAEPNGDIDTTAHIQILSDGTFISLWGSYWGGGTVQVMASSDEGRTWKKISEFTPKVPGLKFVSRALPLFRLPDDTLLWTARFDDPNSDIWYADVPMFRSEDGGITWSKAMKFHDHSPEGGITMFPSGRLLAVLRYQRPRWPEDPDNLEELTRGGSATYNPRSPYKHVFLMDSDDKGKTWKNFRQLATFYGQCNGFPAALSDGTAVVVRTNGYKPAKSGVAMISYDEGQTWEDEAYYMYAPAAGKAGGIGHSQSVVLADDLILTIAGTTDTGGRASHAAAIGRSDLTAIRWKPAKRK